MDKAPTDRNYPANSVDSNGYSRPADRFTDLSTDHSDRTALVLTEDTNTKRTALSSTDKVPTNRQCRVNGLVYDG